MAISQNPIRTTILYGLICGLSFIPVNFGLNYIHTGPRTLCLTLFLFVAGYCVLLARRNEKPLTTVAFPLLLLFLAVFISDSMVIFFLLALIVISWIRSEICFRNPGGVRLAVELSICIESTII